MSFKDSRLSGGMVMLVIDLNSKNTNGASLVAQWLRIRLPMQETRV